MMEVPSVFPCPPKRASHRISATLDWWRSMPWRWRHTRFHRQAGDARERQSSHTSGRLGHPTRRGRVGRVERTPPAGEKKSVPPTSLSSSTSLHPLVHTSKRKRVMHGVLGAITSAPGACLPAPLRSFVPSSLRRGVVELGLGCLLTFVEAFVQVHRLGCCLIVVPASTPSRSASPAATTAPASGVVSAPPGASSTAPPRAPGTTPRAPPVGCSSAPCRLLKVGAGRHRLLVLVLVLQVEMGDVQVGGRFNLRWVASKWGSPLWIEIEITHNRDKRASGAAE